MVPIAVNNNQPFDGDTFKNYLLDVCAQHKLENRALAFAFIVYDFGDYTINKILSDTNYWTSLDKMSGYYLSVFYINTQDEYFRQRQKQIYQEEKLARQQAVNNGYISFMVPLTIKPTPLDHTITFIKKEFDISDDLKTPFVLFFQTDGEEILDFIIVSLKEEKLEDAFLELRKHIQNAVAALSNVSKENYKNHQEIFDLLKLNIRAGKFTTFIEKKVVSKLNIRTITTIVKLLTGGH